MQSKNCEITIASSPGKALVVGGYLVLDRKFKGLVIAVDARVYTCVKTTFKEPNQQNSFTVRVNSFQFTDGIWEYTVSKNRIDSDNYHAAVQPSGASSNKNKFIQTVLENSFWLIGNKNPDRLNRCFDEGTAVEIVVGTDNEFYSSPPEEPSDGKASNLSAGAIPKFNYTGSTIGDVNKTGLGSSAALVTSMCASLLIHFGIVPKSSFESISSPSFSSSSNNYNHLESLRDRDIVHSLAQYAHCFAQGKIGSGFDVSSALYGSQIYCRFSPSLFQPAMQSGNVDMFLEAIAGHQVLDSSVEPICMPPGFKLVLADINAGSNTPSMVKRVLEWKASDPNSLRLWDELDTKNMLVCKLWQDLNQFYVDHSSIYTKVAEMCSALSVNQMSNFIRGQDNSIDGESSISKAIVGAFILLSKASYKVRQLMKLMGDKAQVPIEPDCQTALLDECMQNPGVLMAGVPGAGGYDAIYCVCVSESSARNLVETFKTFSHKIKYKNVSPLGCNQTSSGCTIHNVDSVPQLLKHLS